ncbi:hypothetical protein SBOR_4512 [Sclerotinia borealis F-4128]|uniref:HNH nuclease domain-containing protein n=1 Tax=Sclerotinia borealis (strain F-4128) TaxID=1432307 RepID=W9CGV8_SCLBF|nr:hypothetical protein SBOR_4512 [Sclerotinia borealis F-4128]
MISEHHYNCRSLTNLSLPTSTIYPISAYTSIKTRDAATLYPDPPPDHYQFLIATPNSQKYRIFFRHPAYPPGDNIIFILHALDHADGGIHHGLAHCACSIFADNRIDGYLSRTCNDEYGDRIDAAWDDILPAGDVDYYFYVPYPSETPLPPANTSRKPYRWPIVTNFQDWRFPKVMHEVFTRHAKSQDAFFVASRQLNWTEAISKRDAKCPITAFISGTEAVHLVPEHEEQRFLSNSMARWNHEFNLEPEHWLRDLSNGVLLRSDMQIAFDFRQFVFFPKGDEGFVVHMLGGYTPDIGQLHHNTRVCIPHCSLAFLYSRFAWSIIPFLTGFLSRPRSSQLVVRSRDDTGERVIEEVTNTFLLPSTEIASQSTSSKSRSRDFAGQDDSDIEHNHRKRRRICRDSSSSHSSDSTKPSLDYNQPTFRASEVETANNIHSPNGVETRIPPHLSPEQFRVEELRREALERQRPENYNPQRPPYDRHRPAIEELEIMGVEIRDELDDEDL